MANDATSHSNMTQPKADIVLKNGVIYTVDKDRSRAESIAVNGRKIVYIGSNAGVTDFIDKNTNVIDLEGKMVLPGFIDSHAHVSFGVSMVTMAQLFNLLSLDDYQRSIHNFAEKRPDLEAIYGNGWNNELFPPTGPRKEDIDAVVSDRPASMVSNDGHAIWVNSAALKTAGITKDTTNPAGGVIERDPETGEPSGTLRENAMDLIHNVLPPFTVEQLKEGILAYVDTAAKEGITTVHDPMLILPNETGTLLGAGFLRNNIAAFSQLAAENRLTIRVRGSYLAAPEKGSSQLPAFIAERKKQKDPLFQAYSIKIFADGVIEGSTGYLLEPYEHMPGFRGTLLWDPEVLKESLKVFDKENFQIHVHSIGDAATRITLDAFEYTRNANGDRDSRHQITHLQLVDPEDIPRFASLDVIGIPQPIWHLKGEYYTQLSLPYLGRQRADRQYPMKSFINAGVKMASASDYPVTVPCPPLLGIMIGTTRCEPGIVDADEVLWPQECMSLDEMIASFTINGAYANCLEQDTGSLEVGKAADLVVLDRNLFEIPASEINHAKVLLTLFEGQEVYRDNSF
jgi:predicted amidohydrolase YtcJ